MFVDFEERIFALEGKVGQILSLRSRYLNGDKMTNDEKFVAKDILTSEQSEFKEKVKYESDKQTAISLISGVEDLVKKNQERRRK